MEPFEYVVVLTSLILGLGIAQILTSVADILSHIKKVKLSLPHTLMIVVIFFLHIQEWWISYQNSHVVGSWTLGVVLSVLTYPILLFTLARMMFPTGIRGHETDLDAYFRDQWRWLYSIILATIIISIWQNSYIHHIPFVESWPQMLYAVVYLSFILWREPSQKAHIVLQILAVISMIAYIVVNDTTLGM